MDPISYPVKKYGSGKVNKKEEIQYYNFNSKLDVLFGTVLLELFWSPAYLTHTKLFFLAVILGFCFKKPVCTAPHPGSINSDPQHWLIETW